MIAVLCATAAGRDRDRTVEVGADVLEQVQQFVVDRGEITPARALELRTREVRREVHQCTSFGTAVNRTDSIRPRWLRSISAW